MKLRLHRIQHQHDVLLHLWNVTGQRGTRTTAPYTHQWHSFTLPFLATCSQCRLHHSMSFITLHAMAMMLTLPLCQYQTVTHSELCWTSG